LIKPVLLSVLITCYNREDYIGEAIESVLASSFQNFELIISDDASTDKTLLIAKAYQAKDSRIRILVNDRNTGQFANRNKAASHASGEYIKFLDSDDVIYPYSLQIMMDAMLQYPDAGLGFCEKYRESSVPYPYLINPKEVYLTHYLKHELLMIGPSGLIIKKDSFKAVHGFEEYGMPSDNHLALKIAARNPVVGLQRDLFWWRIHEGQVFSLNKANHQNVLNNYQFNVDLLKNYSPLSEEENKMIIRNQKKIFYRNLVNILLKGKTQTVFSLFRQYRSSKYYPG
jgi:glycosyltransferase involved in cell wall biosynthesis